MSWLGTGINIVIIMLNSYENVREYRRGNENGACVVKIIKT
jgi:hypothetical protein